MEVLLTFVWWLRLTEVKGLISVGRVGPTKVKGLPGSDKTYPDSPSCPHTRPPALPDLVKTSPPGRPFDLTAARRYTRPRRRSTIRPPCVTANLTAIWPPHVCPIAPSPDASHTTRDTPRRPDTWACSATGASSPTPVPPPQPAPPTTRTYRRPAPAPPVLNSGAPPRIVPAPPYCHVPLDRAHR
jgi:hypothetical protein